MTQSTHSVTKGMYIGIELSRAEWRFRFGDGQTEREKRIPAWDLKGLDRELTKSKTHFGLPKDAPVYSCYEAGREAFSVHRMLTARGVINLVVDPSSIEVNRHARRVKTDRLDAIKLLKRLLQYWLYKEKDGWQVCRVPTVEEEDARRAHREAGRLKKEITAHTCRIKSLLTTCGIALENVAADLERVKDYKGDAVPAGMLVELKHDQQRLVLAKEQLKSLEAERKTRMKSAAAEKPAEQRAVKLASLKGVGEMTGWMLSHEFFWRDFRNGRQVGSSAGLTGCPYDSGDSRREQGISKAGNARVRTLMVELAWRWLMFQPDSALSRWFHERFDGRKRSRRVGIVALARRLLVALWKFQKWDIMPEGAILANR